jgi:hypothetical protein
MNQAVLEPSCYLDQRLLEEYPMSLKNVFVIKEISYEEAMEVDDLTPKEVQRELRKHDASWDEFVAEVGEKPVYTGEEVLSWLGY